ncbi:hypothetical protein [Micromonospora cremea]|uniref:Uncharacterized protein n=1 Tax=Micromonospora cremea TaxID=709881 RepID=A0A1N5U267_9ACTN|nr:hypothetical protein [Micromonospora cremea]SIM54882.1 hypothetical protein SAMN04489832_0558 [Micromonospora cremea]
MTTADRDPPTETTVHLHARVDGTARAYQVGYGTQVIHHHYPAELGRKPLDPANLRLWIDRMAADYRDLISAGRRPARRRETATQANRLASIAGSVAGAPGRTDPMTVLRHFLAAGAAQYLFRTGPLPQNALPEHIVLDFTVFALWPVVQAPSLPDGWEVELAEITSPRLARLVARARIGHARQPEATMQAFAREIADKPFAHGVLSLLEDFSDPRLGGAYLTPLALAAGYPAPPRETSARNIFTWFLAGAAAGLGIATVDHTVDLVWEWMRNRQHNPLTQVFEEAVAGTSTNGEQTIHGGRRLAPDRQGDGANLIDNIIDELFH